MLFSVSIASGPCEFNNTSELAIQCTINAECVRRGQFSECKCIHGFLQTVDGDCVKVFGSPCEVGHFLSYFKILMRELIRNVGN